MTNLLNLHNELLKQDEEISKSSTVYPIKP